MTFGNGWVMVVIHEVEFVSHFIKILSVLENISESGRSIILMVSIVLSAIITFLSMHKFHPLEIPYN